MGPLQSALLSQLSCVLLNHTFHVAVPRKQDSEDLSGEIFNYEGITSKLCPYVLGIETH